MRIRSIVINLDRRPDRMENFTKQRALAAPELPVVRTSAVDGRSLVATKFLSHLFRGNDFGFRRGVVGCALSHLELWQRLLSDPAVEGYLILEDDVIFNGPFLPRFRQLLADLPRDGSINLLFLGGMQPLHQLRGEVWRCAPGVGYGTTAYLITREGARRALALAEQVGIHRAIDWFLIDHFATLGAAVAEPWLAKGPFGGETDIQNHYDPLPTNTQIPLPNTPLRRVALMGDWCSPAELRSQWSRMGKDGPRWDALEIVEPGAPADLAVVVNRAPLAFNFDATLLIQMEPRSGREGWGLWRDPSHELFWGVWGHGETLNNVEWHLGKTYRELSTESITKSRELSSVTSSMYAQVGHRKRIDFLKYCESAGLQFDLFGHDNAHGFASYRGALPPYQKEDGLYPYRYTIACENSSWPGYATEKLWDGILAECLTFYWGAPNIADFLHPHAFVWLDLDDFSKALASIRDALTRNLWEERLPIIRQEKHRILNELQFFPRLERFLRAR